MDTLKDHLFGEKFIEDRRRTNPLLAFLTTRANGDEYLCAILPPDYRYMMQIMLLLTIQTIISAAIAVVVYTFIVSPQVVAAKSKRTPPTSIFLIGFGVVIPFVALEPLYLINVLDIRNKGLRMMIVGLFVQTSLRILQAMYGFTPIPRTASLKNFMIYFSCLFDISFDGQMPVRAKSQYIRKQLAKLVRDYFLLSIIISFLSKRDYIVFETEFESHSLEHGLKDLLSWRHMANNFLIAYCLSTGLSQSTLGVSLIYNLVYGFETDEVVLNPMLKSSSPSDFWGRRWNNSVHKGLKNGCYKPARSYFKSRLTGVIAAFLASGLIHEYVNFGIFFDEPDVRFRWKQLLFFAWNGMLIAMEYTFRRLPIFHWLSRRLSPHVVTFLVISSALPVAHLFVGDYLIGGYFKDIEMAEFIISCDKL